MRRLVVFCVLLFCTLHAEAQFGYHFGRNKVQYERFDWHILETEHFDIYYYPEMEELAEYGAQFAENIYDELEDRFAWSLTKRVPLIFYSSNLHFKQTNVTPGFIPDGVGGFFEFMKGRVVVPSNGDIHRFRRVIRHELVHVFTFSKMVRILRDHRMVVDRRLPLWFTEGLAEYWSGLPNPDHDMIMRDALFANYFQPLESIYRISGTFQMYKEGESFLHFVSERYGEHQILRLVDNCWRHDDFEKVIEFVLGESIEEIDAAWYEWLRERYYDRLDAATPSSLEAPVVAGEGFSSQPVFYRFDDGRRVAVFVGNRDGYANLYSVELDSTFSPSDDPRVLVAGERSARFESFHLLDTHIDISEDGRVAFATKSGGQDVLHVFDLRQDEIIATYRFDELVAIYGPSWGPEGRRIAFASIDRSGFSDIFYYDLDADRLHRLTDDAYDDRAPDWHPTEPVIAFSSDRGSEGRDGFYNLFAFDTRGGTVLPLTFGQTIDDGPSWSVDGAQLAFTRTERDTSGVYSPRHVYVGAWKGDRLELESRTDFTNGAYQPSLTPEGRLLLATYEDRRFSVRQVSLDRLEALRPPANEPALADTSWSYEPLKDHSVAQRIGYERSYGLDIAQGQFSQNPVWGSTGGATFAFSDMLGDDHWLVTLYNSPATEGSGSILERINFDVTRVQLQGRANLAYGIHRFSGRTFDITDPLANEAGYPLLYETIWGGFGAVSYPLSKFRRVEMSTSLDWSKKQLVSAANPVAQRSWLLSNQIKLSHDNALYGMNGPAAGWRAYLLGAYTTDIAYSEVSYFTLGADLRTYVRLLGPLTFASRYYGRYNHGRQARLGVLGGSWSLRGWDFFDVRGRKMWFTSHELRFPIVNAPAVYLPLLEPFGVRTIRGALFLDAAHAWNTDYQDEDLGVRRREQLNTGTTLGSLGAGLRVNIFGGFVLRYDVGWRYTDFFGERDRFFRQFFFGWDF